MGDGSNTQAVVLFPGALGDLLLAMPAIQSLRHRHAGGRLTLAVSRALRPLAAALRAADTITNLDDAEAVGLFSGDRVPRWLGERPRLYAWLGSRDPALRARLRALASAAEFHAVVRTDGPEHASVAYAEQVGVAYCPLRWTIPAAEPRVTTLLATLPRPILAIHLGAGSPAKRWTVDGFHELARRWEAGGGGVCEIVGPADGDIVPVDRASRVVDWPLVDVMALLAGVDCYVGNDSGITHLAAAAGARGVALFGPTSARRWAPLDSGIVGLTGGLRDDAAQAVEALAPARVWEALDRHDCLDKLQSRA